MNTHGNKAFESNTYDSEVRRLRGHLNNCDGYRKICETHSGLMRLEFTYLRAMQKPLTVRMDVSMDQIEEAENNAKP
jgi:hypothetical protein